MNKLAFIFVISILMTACGVQRPYAPTISSVNGGNAALPFADQSGIRVQANSAYAVRLEWNVTNTGAMGVKIIIADGADYYCQTPLATRSYYIPDSSTISNSPLATLGYMFKETPNLFQYGRSYAICVASILYSSVSEPSFPVFLDIVSY